MVTKASKPWPIVIEPAMMNNHIQPDRPWTPFISRYSVACKTPRNMAPATSLTLKKARRTASSDGLYQLKIKATTLGQKLADNNPRKNRNA